jgi:hypothetical protein
MWNSISAPTGQRESRDYLAARENWLKRILASRDLTTRARLVASALYFYFNQEEFVETGELWAWPGLRMLDEKSGLARNTVRAGIDDLVAAGHLEVQPRYDEERRRHTSHRYRAIVPRGVGQNQTLKSVQN